MRFQRMDVYHNGLEARFERLEGCGVNPRLMAHPLVVQAVQVGDVGAKSH
jgi:hypothetical protein